MKLSEQVIFDGLEFSNVFVRDACVRYFSEAKRRDAEVPARLIPLIDQHGWQDALLWPHHFTSFDLDPPSLTWVLDEIKRFDCRNWEDKTWWHLTQMVTQAPIDVLRPQLDRINGLDHFNVEPRFAHQASWTASERLCQRLDVWEQTPEDCWSRLHDHCQMIGEVESFADADIPFCELLLERIASARDEFAPAVLKELETDEVFESGPEGWIVGLMIMLAGHTRLEESVPKLLRWYEEDWDWYNEQILYALVRIGTPSVLETVSQRYASQLWYVRNFLVGVVEGIHQDNSVDCILPMVESEEDDHLRGQLGIALSAHFDDRGVAAAREIYLENLEDPERETIIQNLFAHACLTDIDLPEKDEWGQQIKENWDATERKRAKVDLESFFRLDQDADEWDDGDDETMDSRTSQSDTYPRLQPIVNTGSRIGRNDPCPCGSGKKYKKCCLRQSSP